MIRLAQMVRLWIGIDDTDSKDGMCTTYVGAVVVDRLRKLGAKIIDFPRLIRLNPNWKLKTRGNCAVALNVEVEEQKVPGVKNIVLKTVEELAELDHDTTNPGVVFYQSEKIPAKLKAFSKKVIQDTVTIEEAGSSRSRNRGRGPQVQTRAWHHRWAGGHRKHLGERLDI